MRRYSLIGLAAALALSLVHPLAAQSKNEQDIKDIGHRGVGVGVNLYSLEKEVALGKMYSQQLEAMSHMIKDPVVTEYVNRVGQNLVRNSDAHVPFTIKVIDSPEINAVALPGGYFYVNSGLVLAADEESELAGVMAHEIAHVAARHGTRNMTKAEIANYLTFPLIFVAGPAGLAGRSLASLAVPMSFLKFDRSAEREADYLGLQYMYKTGYDPQSFITMFEKVESKEKKTPSSVSKMFATHPQTPDRIRASEKEIATVLPPRPEYIVTTSDFDTVKARLAVIEHESQTEHKLHGDNRPSLRHPDQNNKQDNGKPTLKRRPDSSD
jgi:predicted Zn-dependent protease